MKRQHTLFLIILISGILVIGYQTFFAEKATHPPRMEDEPSPIPSNSLVDAGRALSPTLGDPPPDQASGQEATGNFPIKSPSAPSKKGEDLSDEFWATALQRAEGSISEEYDEYLLTLNLSTEQIANLKIKILALWQAKLEDIRSGLDATAVSARFAALLRGFEAGVRELLGNKADEYFTWELEAAARREERVLAEYLRYRGIDVSKLNEAEIAALIADEEAYTLPALNSVHPYVAFRASFSTTLEDMAGRVQERIDMIEDAKRRLLDKAVLSGLGAADVDGIRDYYDARSASLEPRLARLVDPYNARATELKEQLAAAVQSGADDETIASLARRKRMWEEIAAQVEERGKDSLIPPSRRNGF